MHDDDGSGDGVSIGEEDQLRDREMLRELQDEGGRQGDRPDRKPVAARPADRSDDRTPTDNEWHPGEAGQPDRTASEGLTGSGPSQPDP